MAAIASSSALRVPAALSAKTQQRNGSSFVSGQPLRFASSAISRLTMSAEAPAGFTPPELKGDVPSPIFGGSTGGLLRKAQDEEFYVITWESKKEQVFEMPTGGAATMRAGENSLKLARKEQCLALGTQLRTKFKINYQFYRVFPSGEVQYLHPKDGCWRGVAASASSPAASASSMGTGGPAVSEAVIVGGGLAGLATAIGLRNIGIDAQVYEARDEVQGKGTFIVLFPNGLRALSRIDPAIVPQLISRGVPNPTVLSRSPTGDPVIQWDLASNMTTRFGFPMLGIRWQEVLDVLRGMLPNDAVHHGHRLVGFTQGEEEGGGGSDGSGTGTSNGEVKCVFRRVIGGEERLLEVETPLLLGADGIHSEARKQLLGRSGNGGAAGEGVSPRDNGRTSWRAIIDSSLCPHPLLQPRQILTTLGVNRTANFADAAAGKLCWALTLVDSADPTVSSERSSGGEEAREKILRAFEGWDVVTQLVLATPPDLILERHVLDLPPLPFWVHGHTALLGDAAHAVTPALGQGANLAFEDAAQLVECLRAHSHVSDALRSFQFIRMPRVHAVASRNIAHTKELYDEKKEKKAAGDGRGVSSSDGSEGNAVPKIEEVQAASAAVAVREGRDPDEDLFGYDVVWKEHLRGASVVH
ncbi:unnamed protein product [Closterium sp. Naga37s-1]|nr:unnamed protein product [Closterium sp. Naga37s-1]